MSLPLYRRLRDTAHRIAGTLPKPAFYGRHETAIHRANETLLSNEIVSRCRERLDASQLECAHGLYHCESVARDAGAIVLVASAENGILKQDIDILFTAAIIAGLLHDIKRKEQDHAVRGSIEAERILKALGVDERSRSHITYAIRNHEAFKTTCDLDDEGGCMVSDALYDADKFRWGPENFTGTLWLMVEAHHTPP